ncbi:netrin receptor UNC5B-like isoform X2 [Venturia canescens]|uniref:netrin receptor UNC5B-like isoform X2 n=1 Tax=Venturia canescens TaxID=32260 RepID=UPI001C9CC9AF|nr:netrin receptor UNC5B-like isoform X2 [Venturia canescens]
MTLSDSREEEDEDEAEEDDDPSYHEEEYDYEDYGSATIASDVDLISGGSLPMFLIEPNDSFVVKGRPATLHCRAAHALQVYFRCNGVRNEGLHQDFVDPRTGTRIIDVELNVTRNQIEEYFGKKKFNCECVAWSGSGEIRGRAATVEVSYLKKHFLSPPYSMSVEAGRNAELRCVPPLGVPRPNIYWLKNGSPIESIVPPISTRSPGLDGAPVRNEISSSSIDLLQSAEEGNLVLGVAELRHQANYTCVAENLAARRPSEPAVLTVYVNGGWSSWSGWSECSVRCGRGIQRRTRTCSNPSPINGGQTCPGPATQRMECSPSCPAVDGRWSAWSGWSACGPDCLRVRKRSCNDPPPSDGGRICPGKEIIVEECFSDRCAALSQDGPRVFKEATTSIDQKNFLALWISLTLALLVLGLATLFVVRLMRRKERINSLYGVARLDFRHANNLAKSVVTRGERAALTGRDHLGRGETEVTRMPRSFSEHHYDVPQLSLPSTNGPSPSSSAGSRSTRSICKTPQRPRVSSDIEEAHPPQKASQSPVSSYHRQGRQVFLPSIGTNWRSENSENTCNEKQEEEEKHESTENLKLVMSEEDNQNKAKQQNEKKLSHKKSGIFEDEPSEEVMSERAGGSVVKAAVDEQGALLVVPEAGVSMSVPEGAASRGRRQNLYLAVLGEDCLKPNLPSTMTLLSGVVACGPSKLELIKPMILQFEHCAELRTGNWELSVWHCELDLEARCNGFSSLSSTSTISSTSSISIISKWHKVLTLGGEPTNLPGQPFAQLDHAGVFLVTETPGAYVIAGESSVVAPGLAIKRISIAVYESKDRDLVRCHVVEDTRATSKVIEEQEKRIGGSLIERGILSYRASGAPLCIDLEDRESGFTDRQEVPYRLVWSSSKTSPCRTFKIERITSDLRLGFELRASQRGFEEHGLVLRIDLDLTTKHRSSLGVKKNEKTETSVIVSRAKNGGRVNDAVVPKTFRFSKTLRRQLCQCLDPPSIRGNDWRMLAQRLQVDRYVDYFATKASPTEHILDLWEARHREATALADLLNHLRLMGRVDAATVLETRLGPWI